MTKYILFATVLLSGSAFAATEPNYHFAVGQGKVSFLAVGRPSAIKIHGEGEGVTGDLKRAGAQSFTGSLDFKLDSLKTGIDTRDEHMKKKYLETEAHPTARLELKEVKLPEGKLDANDVPFTGLLTLHGVQKAVTGQVSVHGDGKGPITVSAKFPVILSDFGIEIPSYAGITVAKSVDIAIETQATLAEKN